MAWYERALLRRPVLASSLNSHTLVQLRQTKLVLVMFGVLVGVNVYVKNYRPSKGIWAVNNARPKEEEESSQKSERPSLRELQRQAADRA